MAQSPGRAESPRPATSGTDRAAAPAAPSAPPSGSLRAGGAATGESGGDPLQQSPSDRADGNSAATSWAREGYRRVRSDRVRRRMRWLTGVAAIGGFLFGYDTYVN